MTDIVAPRQYTEDEWEELSDDQKATARAAWAQYEAAVEAEKKRIRDEYFASSPIKRIEHWLEVTAHWPISMAQMALGEALRDWAREQQGSA